MEKTGGTLMNTYGRLPVHFARGEGVWLYDEAGKRYLDGISGVGVNALGHAHPAVTEALCQQAKTLIHTSNLYGVRLQEKLADKLCQLTGMNRVFFANSGAEANEAAIKLARLYGDQRGVQKPDIIVMERAFHGRTMATLSASGNRKIQAGFEPLVSGFIRAPYGDLDALRTIAENNSNVVAVLMEPVQGEGGLYPATDDYLRGLRELCDAREWLLMLDEVQTGNARTGRYFYYQHADILPDVVTTAKGLGNGVPIGACLAQGRAAEVFKPGNHGSTFGGSPLACAAALAVVTTIEQQDLAANAAARGEQLMGQLRQQLADVAGVKAVRGRGLMVGIELDRPCAALVGQGLAKGVLINVTAERVVRLLPPLIASEAEIAQLADAVVSLVRDFCATT
ncbi:MAG TPA: aspartate aminotransferase family protein [Spongiibacteraceae bacterium]|jgi:acetylornithine aminotransferase|nr:aspartate aminotransferase family protein [Spongiibacteraceae bacterium]HUH37209.1 aspartate aminotransferase family protein [Spongiibacteraceae bacterium]